MPGSMRDAFTKAGVAVPPKNPPRSPGGSGPRGRGGRRGRRGAGPAPSKLPHSYFVSDSEGYPCLQTDFVARDRLTPIVTSLVRQRPGLTTGQMRRFFNHCRELERQLKVEGRSWERVSAKFAGTSAHAHNALAAGKIPASFRNFIDENVKRVVEADNPKDAFLRGFMPHFEALVGFGAQHLKKGD